MVDIESNPLYFAAAGGLILGIATSLHYILKGRVTGMSGIVYAVASLNQMEISSKLSIIGGMFVAGGLFFSIFQYGSEATFSPFGPVEQIAQHTSYIGFAIAGLLVGFGCKLSNGCTSGHGLCGLARLSLRSFVAVGIFLACALGVGTFGFYMTLGPLSDEHLNPKTPYNHLISARICIAVGAFLPFAMAIWHKCKVCPEDKTATILRDNLISFSVGFLFGVGLLVSGMARRKNILSFLSLGPNWNPSLLFVLGCGVLVNLIAFNYMIRIKKTPIFADSLFNPSMKVDWKLIVGAVCFGVGWGVGGLCPGPFLVMLPVFQLQIHVVWLAGMLAGMFCAARLSAWEESRKVSPEGASAGVGEGASARVGEGASARVGESALEDSFSQVKIHDSNEPNKVGSTSGPVEVWRQK